MAINLTKFKKNELMYNEAETRQILRFIFPSQIAVTKKMKVDDGVRGFAQGLLVQAVDSSYAMGFIEGIFRETANPTAGVKTLIKKFGERALKHWFKHATTDDLREIEIYESVRATIASNYARILTLRARGLY